MNKREIETEKEAMKEITQRKMFVEREGNRNAHIK